ncbi:hypothetical protein NFI96_030686, partial [Prochilodus magdalenae]
MHVTEGRGYEDRVSLFTQELQRGNISLQIRDCRESDTGDYLCQVTNGDTTEECTVEVLRPFHKYPSPPDPLKCSGYMDLKIHTEKNQVKLVVAHITGGNTEIIQPLNVTNTHVIISVQGFSLFGILKKILYPRPIHAQVLLFYKELRDEQRRKKLHIHLLPRNVPVKEVAQFEQDYGPNYHPTFVVFLQTDEVT